MSTDMDRESGRHGDDTQRLMMLVLDGEASSQQQEAFASMLAQDAGLRREYEQMKTLKDMTMKSRPQEPPREIWDGYWQGVYRRLERGVGWILFSIGAIALLLFGAWEAGKEWITDVSIPLWVRIGGVSLAGGTIILLVSVTREKLFLHKRERYKDIQR